VSLLDRLREPIVHGSAETKLGGLVTHRLRIPMQLRSQVRHAFVCLLPTLGEPVMQERCQLRDLMLLPFATRQCERASLQLGGLVVAQGLRQNIDENRLVLGSALVRDYEAQRRMQRRQPT